MRENQMISPEGSIRRAALPGAEDDYIVFAFGKYKDSDFFEVYQKDPQYVQWWGDNVASPYTKKILNAYVREKRKKLQVP